MQAFQDPSVLDGQINARTGEQLDCGWAYLFALVAAHTRGCLGQDRFFGRTGGEDLVRSDYRLDTG